MKGVAVVRVRILRRAHWVCDWDWWYDALTGLVRSLGTILCSLLGGGTAVNTGLANTRSKIAKRLWERLDHLSLTMVSPERGSVSPVVLKPHL